MEILSPEKVTALQEKYPTPKTPAERSEAARQRKRDQRARDKPRRKREPPTYTFKLIGS